MNPTLNQGLQENPELIELDSDELGNFDSLAMCVCIPIILIGPGPPSPAAINEEDFNR